MANLSTKVLIITPYRPPTIGGISTYIQTMDHELHRYGYTTRIIGFPPWLRKLENNARPRTFRFIHRISVIIFIIIGLAHIIYSRIFHKRVIISSHMTGFCLFIGVIGRVLGCNSVHTFHRYLEKRSISIEILSSKVDMIVFISKYQMLEFEKYFSIPNAKKTIIESGIDPKLYMKWTKGSRSDARKKLGLKLTEIVVLYIGRVAKEKGADTLVQAFSDLTRIRKNTILLMVGPLENGQDFYVDKIRDDIEKKKLSKRVQLIGPIPPERLAYYFNAADIFVIPSRNEAFGLSALEAMSFKLPVIAADTGGLRDIIVEGETGFFFQADNADQLINKLITLTDDDSLRNRLGNNGFIRQKKYFSTEKMILKYINIFE